MSCGCGRSPDFCRGWHSLSEEEWQKELAEWQTHNEYDKPTVNKHTVEVTEVHHYTDKLFRFQTTKPNGYIFKAGEFVMIGLGDKTKRAYSITSSPTDDFLEFYSIKVPNGKLTSRLKNIQPGDTLEVGSKSTGTLLLENLTTGRNLWLLATGTGIAPFISLVRQRDIFWNFKEVNVTWTVRTARELDPYKDLLMRNRINFLATVTQDKGYKGFQGRIQEQIEQKRVLPDMNPNEDKVMLCGSMAFNEDLKTILESNGFKEGNTNTPGDYVVEKAFVG